MGLDEGENAIVRKSVAADSVRNFEQVPIDLQARLAVRLFGRALIRGLFSTLGRFVGRVGHCEAPLDYR